MKIRLFLLLAGVVFLALNFGGSSGCGSTTSEDGGGEGTTIVIDNLTFTPENLEATAGQTIPVVNEDSVSHTVTSESAAGAFDDSGDFDTGVLGEGETGSITVPADASPGDVFFFYCDIHRGTMTNPNGTITIGD